MVPADLVALCSALTAGKAPWPLFVHGPAGAGKTRFGLCLVDIIPGAIFWTMEQLAARAFEDRDRYWEAARSAPLLVLDELGTREKVSEYEYTALKKFADLRDRGDGRVAVYLSNLEPAAIASHYDDRIASRILSGSIFHFDGPDQRRMGMDF